MRWHWTQRGHRELICKSLTNKMCKVRMKTEAESWGDLDRPLINVFNISKERSCQGSRWPVRPKHTHSHTHIHRDPWKVKSHSPPSRILEERCHGKILWEGLDGKWSSSTIHLPRPHTSISSSSRRNILPWSPVPATRVRLGLPVFLEFINFYWSLLWNLFLAFPCFVAWTSSPTTTAFAALFCPPGKSKGLGAWEKGEAPTLWPEKLQ